MKGAIQLIIFLSLLSFAAIASSEESPPAKVRIIGREQATVTTAEVRLSDIADITSASNSNDEAVIGLNKINIAKSPLPGKELALPAAKVLERIREEGVRLDHVAYTLPRVIKVTRAARLLSHDEIMAAIAENLRESGRDVSIREIRYGDDIQVAPGELKLSAMQFDLAKPARLGFNMSADVQDAARTTFIVEAEIDEWREIPIASRALQRGAIIGNDDIKMARLNLASVNRDVVLEEEQIVGKELGRALGYGELFSANKLIVPPIITSGDKVTVRYRSRLLEATASATAMEAGMPGQNIKVRNDNSNKIVVGIAIEPGLVEVRP